MYEFLRESLSEAARTHVALQSDRYTVNGTPDGPSYLKVILLTFYVETNATDFHLRETLHNLPKKIKDLKSDVPAFNQHVRETVSDLASGGQVSTDLLVYLFNAYLLVDDHNFKKYIERKKEDYDDNREAVTAESLMTAAETKYNQLKQSKTWKAKTPAEEQLIALTAQLLQAKDQLSKLSKGKSSTSSTKTTSTKSDSSASSNKSSSTSNKRKTDLRTKYPDWRFERKGKDTKLTRNDKTYWWCDVLNMWANHEPKDCRAAKQAKDGNKKETRQHGKSTDNKNLHLAKALIAINQGDVYDSDSS
jgi:hypothetical protein